MRSNASEPSRTSSGTSGGPTRPSHSTSDTHLGPTRAYRWPGSGEPVVFLHGSGGTALMWSQYVEGRRRSRRLRDRHDRRRRTQRAACRRRGRGRHLSRWLDEVAGELVGDRARASRRHLVRRVHRAEPSRSPIPERVRSLTLHRPGWARTDPARPFHARGECRSMAASKLPRSLRSARCATTRGCRRSRSPAVMGMAMTAARRHATRWSDPSR